jgi:hypothetical protein
MDLSQPEHPSAAKIVSNHNRSESGAKKGGAGHNKGRRMSDAQRKQISETQKARWAAKRAS